MKDEQSRADYKCEIFNVIKDSDEPLTKNAVAIEIGLVKATGKVNRVLDELVEEGNLLTGKNGRGDTVYMEGGGEGQKDEGGIVKAEGEFAKPVSEIPRKNYGYKIEPLAGERFKFKITSPDGTVENIAEGERVLVINPGAENQGRYWLSEPGDAIIAIQQFCNDHGFHQYTIQDLKAGSYISQNCELDTRPIVIFVDVNRHNKAAE